jgi:hypothetical protein
MRILYVVVDDESRLAMKCNLTPCVRCLRERGGSKKGP